jgi:hypothetical protein
VICVSCLLVVIAEAVLLGPLEEHLVLFDVLVRNCLDRRVAVKALAVIASVSLNTQARAYMLLSCRILEAICVTLDSHLPTHAIQVRGVSPDLTLPIQPARCNVRAEPKSA